jgi:hypothetical protein
MEAICAQVYPGRLTFEANHFVDCYFPVEPGTPLNQKQT